MQRAIGREQGKSVFETMAVSALKAVGGVFDFRKYKLNEIKVDCKNFDLVKFIGDVQRHAPLTGVVKQKKTYSYTKS